MEKNIIKKIKNTYCRLKTSKIDGVGIFAIRDIPKNKDPFVGIHKQRWHEFKYSDFKKMDKEILKMVYDFFFIGKDGKVLIPEYGLNGMDISFFLNSSEKPNIKTIDGGLNFVAARKIKKGEELTASYKTYY